MVAVLVSSAFAAEPIITEVAPVEQSGIYAPGTWVVGSTPKIVEISSIVSDGVNIVGQAKTGSYVSFEIGRIESGDNRIDIRTNAGDITLGDVQGGYLNISTNKGNITLTGNIHASDKDEFGQSTSSIAVATDGEPGTIIFDGATISNIGIRNACYDESYNASYGSYVVSGNTALKDVYFEGGVLEVAAGASLTLDNVLFATTEDSNNGIPAKTGLTIGDNATLTINAGDNLGDTELLNVKELQIGKGVEIVVTLSNEKFLDLEDSEIKLFSVVDGTVDFSNVVFTFTNGEEYKTGNITSTGGTIFIQDTHIVPEPTTATLSLLALAGLAARRRRK